MSETKKIIREVSPEAATFIESAEVIFNLGLYKLVNALAAKQDAKVLELEEVLKKSQAAQSAMQTELDAALEELNEVRSKLSRPKARGQGTNVPARKSKGRIRPMVDSDMDETTATLVAEASGGRRGR